MNPVFSGQYRIDEKTLPRWEKALGQKDNAQKHLFKVERAFQKYAPQIEHDLHPNITLTWSMWPRGKRMRERDQITLSYEAKQANGLRASGSSAYWRSPGQSVEAFLKQCIQRWQKTQPAILSEPQNQVVNN